VCHKKFLTFRKNKKNGFFEEDAAQIIETGKKYGLKCVSEKKEGQWMAVELKK